MLNTTLGYSRTSDVITWVSRQDNNTHTTYISLANLNTLINYSFNTSLSVPITKWWTSTNSINVYYNDYEGAFLNGQVSQAMLSGELNTQNTIQLSKRWSAEVSVVYLSKQSNGINIIDPLCFVDAGIQWKFAGERGTLRLNGSNLLWAKMKARTQYQNQDFTTVNYDSSRSIHLGLNWKFGSSTTTYRNKTRGGSEELNRLKG
jgi:hypothetical protein